MHASPKSSTRWAKFAVRWSIAVAGVWYIVVNTPLYDKVTILSPLNLPIKATLAQEPPAGDNFTSVWIIDPATKKTREVSARDLVNMPDQKRVTVADEHG